MKEGFWVNWRTNRYVELKCLSVDHEAVLRSTSASWLGVRPSDVPDGFKPRVDRDAFLRHMMTKLPLLRVRGHGGTHITIEFHAEDVTKPFDAIGRWARKYPAPTMLLHVVNLATGECWDVAAGEWDGFAKGV